MTNPMDAGLAGQRVGLNSQGGVANNVAQGNAWDNPNPQHNYPPSTPPIPTPRDLAQPQGGPNSMGDRSPMETFQEKWFNKGQGNGTQNEPPAPPAPGQQPTNNPAPNTPPANNGLDLSNLTAQQFQDLAKQMDFTQGIPDEVMAMFTPDENGAQPNLMQGIMALMNHVGRGVYSQSLAGSGRLAGHGLSQFGERFTKELPTHLQKHNASSVVNGMKVPEALRPSVEGMVNHMLTNNPNATTEELTAMLEEFMGMFGGNSGGASQGQQSSKLNGLFDFN